MGHESKFKPATDAAHSFIKNNITIDNLNVVGSIGTWRPDSVREYWKRAHDNGITVMSMTAAWDPHRIDFLVKYVGNVQKLVAETDFTVAVYNSEDIEKAQRDGKLGIMFCTQGSECLNGDAENVGLLKRLGFSSVALAYNLQYQAATGRYQNDEIGGAGGLTLYGRKVIDELVKNSIPLDWSHLNKRSSIDSFNYLQQTAPQHPIIFTHSGPEEVCGYPYRNVTDEEIKMVAKTGGFVGLTLFSIMVGENGYGPITFKRVIEMIDHIVNLVGIDHVALGSDDSDDNIILDQWGASADLYPDNGWVFERCTHAIETKEWTDVWEPAKTWAALYDALKEHGYSDNDCAKIFGGNSMRVYKKCEENARILAEKASK